MASQGERELGILGMSFNLEAMVQDKIPVQDTPEQDIIVQEQSLPQMNPEPEMGAAAAAEYDTSPSLLRNHPLIPAETAHPRARGVAQLFAMLVEMSNKMDTNARKLMDKMDGMIQTRRGETRQVGQCLQAGKMAPPRAATNELGGNATAVRPTVAAGEDRVIRETCWARRVKVTETVTQGGKLIGVTETCTSETRREVTELTGTREIEERLHGGDGVGDAHTHTHR